MSRDGTPDQPSAGPRGVVSVALLACVACMPIVIAIGFMTDRAPNGTLPGDISVAAMRGGLDGSTTRPAPPARAGF